MHRQASPTVARRTRTNPSLTGEIRNGGGGGGRGEGTGPGNEGGQGFGTGFGLGARPVGVYEIRDRSLHWKPAIDVDRLARGAQVLAGIVTACVSLVVLRRR